MRIVAWNVNHQPVPKRPQVPAKNLVSALVALDADVLFLNEYFRTRDQQAEEDGLLDEAGYKAARSPRADHREKKDNQILVVSRRPPIDVVFSAADEAPYCALENYLHIALPTVAIVGLRVPAFKKSREAPQAICDQRREHWKWLDRTLQPLADGRTVLLGDMNADPAAKDQNVFFTQMSAAGWKTKSPAAHLWSYQSRSVRQDGKEQRKTRIDHAFFGKAFELDGVNIEYAYRAGDWALTGPLEEAISDHAALVVEIPE